MAKSIFDLLDDVFDEIADAPEKACKTVDKSFGAVDSFYDALLGVKNKDKKNPYGWDY